MKNRQVVEGDDATLQSETGVSWINILLGVWVLISPYVLGFAYMHRPTWNNIITGVIIAILAIIRTSTNRQPAWSWMNTIAGIWLILSPFALNFVSGVAFWNNVILGIIITIVAWGSAVRAQTVTA